MRTTVKPDLKLSSLKPKNRQHFTVFQQQKRPERARRREKLFFSDEKIFTLEAKFNPQNDRVLAQHSEDVPEDMLTVYRRQKPASVMVWAAVSKTWKSPLIFVKQGAKVNTNVYIDDILAPALRDMKEHFKNEDFTIQQDGAPFTPLTKPKLGAKRISRGFGARNCGLLHRPISTQWTSVFGPCWKLRPVAHHTQLWSL